jgi:hypothetical protein
MELGKLLELEAGNMRHYPHSTPYNCLHSAHYNYASFSNIFTLKLSAHTLQFVNLILMMMIIIMMPMG